MFQLICDFFIAILTIVILSLGISVWKNDIFGDITIYKQGIDDWSVGLWLDFTVASGECPLGYESIGNKWLGTVWGNYT